jgi:hypothetical protein
MNKPQSSRCFCKACLTGVDAKDMSPDERYCTLCFNFLLREKELHPDNRGSRIPKGQIGLTKQVPLPDG